MNWRSTINRFRRAVFRRLGFKPLFGESSQGQYLPYTRISPSSHIDHEDRLRLHDHVYIGHYCWIEASGNVTLHEGVQLTSHVSIVTHSSHRSMRLLGRDYATWNFERTLPQGWVNGPVEIGAYCFVGPHTLIEANTWLGKGCIVKAGSVVRGHFPEFSVIAGAPAQIVGDSRQADCRWLEQDPHLQRPYQAWAGPQLPSQVDGSKADQL